MDYFVYVLMCLFLIVGVYQFYFWTQNNNKRTVRSLEISFDRKFKLKPKWVWIYSGLYYPIIVFIIFSVSDMREFNYTAMNFFFLLFFQMLFFYYFPVAWWIFSLMEEDLLGVGSMSGHMRIKIINPITTNPIALPIQSISEYFSFSSSIFICLEFWIYFRNPSWYVAFVFVIGFYKPAL